MSAVEMRGISMVYENGFQALSNVDLTVSKGTLHAVVGENGAGKTTLMRILNGGLAQTNGTLTVLGQKRNFRSVRNGMEAGVGMMSQHAAILPGLSVWQNLVLGAEGSALLDRSGAIERGSHLAAQLGFELDMGKDGADLSPAEAQKLEVLKLLWRKAEVMILDEPTAMLSPGDSTSLFKVFRLLAEQGKTILLVTHRLREVFDYCQDVSVLRKGQVTGDGPVASFDPTTLAERIVGQHVLPSDRPSDQCSDQIRLQLKDVSLETASGWKLRNVNLELRAGEMLALAGVDGNGQKELFDVLLRTETRISGDVELDGKSTKQLETADLLRTGVRLIAEDRLNEALIADWSLEANALLGFQRQIPLRKAPEIAVAAADRFDTQRQSLKQPIGGLSGGNQQRFVAGRALFGDPKLILAFQPSRGLDILATRAVYQGIRDACANGASAIVVGFDLDELLEFCGNFAVMSHGQLKRVEPNAGAIGRAMGGE